MSVLWFFVAGFWATVAIVQLYAGNNLLAFMDGYAAFLNVYVGVLLGKGNATGDL